MILMSECSSTATNSYFLKDFSFIKLIRKTYSFFHKGSFVCLFLDTVDMSHCDKPPHRYGSHRKALSRIPEEKDEM